MAKIKSLGGVGMAKIKSLGGVENQNVLNFRGKKLNRLGGVFFNFSRRNFSILVFNFHIGTTLPILFHGRVGDSGLKSVLFEQISSR